MTPQVREPLHPALSRALLLLAAAAVAAGAFYAGRTSAAGTEPGSAADPVVAKSYVDQFIQVQVVELQAGQSLIAEGGAELVLRSGKATAIDSPQGGLADLTGAVDLKAGADVPLNHLLLVPRTDGRGFKATTRAFAMVRGGYSVQ